MAQKLLEKYKMPYLSIDHLKMGLIRANINCRFTQYDSDRLIAEKIWPILKGIIMTNIENKQNIIIEGCYLFPDLIRELGKEYLEQIIFITIIFSPDYIKNNFELKIIRYRSVIENRLYQENRPISYFIKEHQELKKECIENNLTYFEINKDYEEEIQKVYEFIDNRVKLFGIY